MASKPLQPSTVPQLLWRAIQLTCSQLHAERQGLAALYGTLLICTVPHGAVLYGYVVCPSPLLAWYEYMAQLLGGYNLDISTPGTRHMWAVLQHRPSIGASARQVQVLVRAARVMLRGDYLPTQPSSWARR